MNGSYDCSSLFEKLRSEALAQLLRNRKPRIDDLQNLHQINPRPAATGLKSHQLR